MYPVIKYTLRNIYPFLFIALTLLPLTFFPKAQIVLAINGLHQPFLDRFFLNVTWLGEGFLVITCIICVIFTKYRWLFGFIIGLILHIVLIQVNKQYLFNDILRPLGYFKYLGKEEVLHFVDGLKIYHKVSFPSGHTTGAAFATSFIALLFRRKSLSIVMACIAILVGISRMYLGQHFFMDIYFGFLFGSLSSLIGYYFGLALSPKFKFLNYTILPKRRLLRLIADTPIKIIFSKKWKHSASSY